MRIVAGLVAGLLILGIAGLVIIKMDSRSSSEAVPTPSPISDVAPAQAPISQQVAPLPRADTGVKCINPPLNTICAR